MLGGCSACLSQSSDSQQVGDGSENSPGILRHAETFLVTVTWEAPLASTEHRVSLSHISHDACDSPTTENYITQNINKA